MAYIAALVVSVSLNIIIQQVTGKLNLAFAYKLMKRGYVGFTFN